MAQALQPGHHLSWRWGWPLPTPRFPQVSLTFCLLQVESASWRSAGKHVTVLFCRARGCSFRSIITRAGAGQHQRPLAHRAAAQHGFKVSYFTLLSCRSLATALLRSDCSWSIIGAGAPGQGLAFANTPCQVSAECLLFIVFCVSSFCESHIFSLLQV